MQYKVGMYGGSFDPPHIGHMNCIIRAASVCEDLYVVLSFSRIRDRIPMEHRYRWLYNSFKHMSHVHIILLEDAARTKEDYDTEEAWESGRDEVIRQIGKEVDVVFCGSDYRGTNRYEKLYGCPVIYFDRNEFPVSSTEIARDPLGQWEYLPEIVRPYFVKKVLLIGGESTGKSTLAQNLALAFNTNFLHEVGRDVCDYAGGNENLMIEEDFHEILLRHKLMEMEADFTVFHLRSSNVCRLLNPSANNGMGMKPTVVSSGNWFRGLMLSIEDILHHSQVSGISKGISSSIQRS